MSRILVVDDEERIREVIKTYGKYEGYEVDTAQDGLEAIELAKENDYDVTVMDIMMPNLDGYSAHQEIAKFKDIPVIMLSSRGEEYDKLFGFEIGIDDYVVKPFSPKELMARINVIIKRNSQERKLNKVWQMEGLEIDLDGHVISVDGEAVSATPKEFELLTYFIQNEGKALSRDQLLSSVWGYDFFGDDRTVDTHIKMLRNTLGQYRKFIITVRGVGYKFDSENPEVKK
ncbi:MAG: response regulator transcription factor [Tissierellia bacterium]|nr:response regulator transcription factor [Tissierellia bacterium]